MSDCVTSGKRVEQSRFERGLTTVTSISWTFSKLCPPLCQLIREGTASGFFRKTSGRAIYSSRSMSLDVRYTLEISVLRCIMQSISNFILQWLSTGRMYGLSDTSIYIKSHSTPLSGKCALCGNFVRLPAGRPPVFTNYTCTVKTGRHQTSQTAT